MGIERVLEGGPERGFVVGSETLPSEKHPERNEDALLSSPERGVFALFDGMGGHRDGERASRIARDAILRGLEHLRIDPEDIEGARREVKTLFDEARRALQDVRREEYGEDDGGVHKDLPDTTLTLARIVLVGEHERFLAYVHVGDSRLYVDRRSEDSLEQITTDDDAVGEFTDDLATQNLIRQALDRATRPEDLQERIGGIDLGLPFRYRNVVLNSLAKSKSPQTGVVPVASGDYVVLTSDGIHDNLARSEIQNIVGDAESADEIARALIAAAKERAREGGHFRAKPDDQTVLAIRVP